MFDGVRTGLLQGASKATMETGEIQTKVQVIETVKQEHHSIGYVVDVEPYLTSDLFYPLFLPPGCVAAPVLEHTLPIRKDDLAPHIQQQVKAFAIVVDVNVKRVGGPVGISTWTPPVIVVSGWHAFSSRSLQDSLHMIVGNKAAERLLQHGKG